MQSDNLEQKEMIKEKLLDTQNQKGGFKTLPFIIVNEAFEKVASIGLTPNMILYLMNEYNLGLTMGTNILNIWSAATNFTSVLGSVVTDSYLGRFRAIGIGSLASLLGMILLWLTAVIPQARPPHCNQSSQTCESPSIFQLLLLYLSFTLMSIGASGIRLVSMAFGADQLDTNDNPEKERSLESYFSWYNIASTASVLMALSFIVYIQDNFGWKLGFGIPAVFMFFSALSFFLASPFYIKLEANKSLVTGLAQVMVASYKNRHLKLPSHSTTGVYHHKVGSDRMVPSNKVRFLNKACIIKNPQQDLTPDESASDPWSLCTVDQVEELKALVKITPLWSAGIMVFVTGSQSPIALLQAKSMDRRITSNLEMPAGSFGTFMIISLMIWLALYDRMILPLASKIRGKPSRLTAKQRMGVGLVFSFISIVVTAIVEHVRRNRAIKEGFSDNPEAVVNMSALWLVPQHCLAGIAEAFNGVGQLEFYYTEFPKSMSSIGMVLFGVGMSVGNLLSTFIFNVVDNATKRGGESWVSRNINRGHFDYYCWLLASFSMINFFYFLMCCRAYGPSVGEKNQVRDEEDGGS